MNLTASPGEGCEFAGWTGDHGDEKQEITITMDGDKVITARFEETEEEKELQVVSEFLIILAAAVIISWVVYRKKSRGRWG
ncbi:MAG: InlB B-repeat-containing protein [Candidatus Natronoplasma sp.]